MLLSLEMLHILQRLPKIEFGIEALPCYDISEVAEVMLTDEDFEADLLSTQMWYCEVEIFSG